MAPKSGPAKARGDIQAGRTGDKTPGFDPAAAPMETDAEAGGIATPSPDIAAMRHPRTVTPEHTNATSYASAMRRPDSIRPARRLPIFVWIVALLAVAVVIWLLLR